MGRGGGGGGGASPEGGRSPKVEGPPVLFAQDWQITQYRHLLALSSPYKQVWMRMIQVSGY